MVITSTRLMTAKNASGHPPLHTITVYGALKHGQLTAVKLGNQIAIHDEMLSLDGSNKNVSVQLWTPLISK